MEERLGNRQQGYADQDLEVAAIATGEDLAGEDGDKRDGKGKARQRDGRGRQV